MTTFGGPCIFGLPAEAVTIATILKSMGYATGQFGKNHLGDKNEFLPTVHGFDEFFGYLYHLDAMEDPAHPNYPQNLLNVVGPRNMVHSWATDKDDPAEMPRLGKIGMQRIEETRQWGRRGGYLPCAGIGRSRTPKSPNSRSARRSAPTRRALKSSEDVEVRLPVRLHVLPI